MIENYIQLAPGHWYQETLTGPMPTYEIEYSKNSYDVYNTTDAMSILRYNLIQDNIGSFDSLCDIGYGNGSFMRYCKEQGKKVSGYDISNYPVPEGTYRILNPDFVDADVMTFFDSLEHMPEKNLVSFLTRKKVKHFCISVPWMHENLGSDWFKTWKHRRENEHLHHFDAHGLIDFLIHCNCKIVYVGNPEDKIRKPVTDYPNILTVIATKK